MKIRIIIIVFSTIVVFYFIQYLLSLIQKKEHFSSHYYDDVERYEDAPKKQSDYDVRISLLNDIDKLEIKDNKIKTKLMEKIFSEKTLRKLKDLSESNRSEEVKDIYLDLKADSVDPTEIIEKKNISEKMKEYVDAASVQVPAIKDYYENDFRNKTSKALDKLDVVIQNLQDMKGILSGVGAKEPYIPDIPVPPKLKEDDKLIEGFENIAQFANF